jgi:2-iminobutanoate/2-iminopropanoate deaminase
MKREIIRAEPLAIYLERWKAPTSAVVRHGDTVYVTGAPPFEPDTGEIYGGSIERQTELVLEQMKLCLETAGSSLENVLKCNVYCTSVEMFAAVNAVYVRYLDCAQHLGLDPRAEGLLEWDVFDAVLSALKRLQLASR